MNETWVLTYRERPWLLNAERSGGSRGVGGRHGCAALTRTWRDMFGRLAVQQQVPPLRHATFVVVQMCRDKRMPDTGNAFPAAKAAIDGLVDAGVLPDDNGRYVHALTFLAPQTAGFDALELHVTGPVCDTEQRAAREAAHRRRLLKELSR